LTLISFTLASLFYIKDFNLFEMRELILYCIFCTPLPYSASILRGDEIKWGKNSGVLNNNKDTCVAVIYIKLYTVLNVNNKKIVRKE
jgi:hypothetical protein